ncbi:MAG: hypothetical protein P1V36_01760 [Planctomycetota bacterium]|nr:hypothetical protein [Planctomycetota bacterium]
MMPTDKKRDAFVNLFQSMVYLDEAEFCAVEEAVLWVLQDYLFTSKAPEFAVDDVRERATGATYGDLAGSTLGNAAWDDVIECAAALARVIIEDADGA